MKILIAPDKFKGSFSAADVAEYIAAGLRDALPRAQLTTLPLADGGEGTAEVICSEAGGEWESCEVLDPLGAKVWARYCTIDKGETAVMEMSAASGLWRVPEELRDPLTATSFGTGQMLLAAARRGVNKIIIGLGGSATNDGGFGMARALGFRFFDGAGAELDGAVSDLVQLARVEAPKNLRLPAIIAAADVRNPLLGARGATRVFGAQKGADTEQQELLEQALTRLADVLAGAFGSDCRDIPGAGAAGGLGFGLTTFCNAAVQAGFEVVAEFVQLEKAVHDADVVITGEGRLDAQTLDGKAPAGVARLARKHGRKSYAIVGQLEEVPGIGELFDDIIVVAREPIAVPPAAADAGNLLREAGRELARRYFTRRS